MNTQGVVEGKAPKFTAKEIALYPFLKEEPDMCRHFLSTFLPTRGFPPPKDDADDAIAVKYTYEVVRATGPPASESKTIYFPKGALVFRGDEDRLMLDILCKMLNSRFKLNVENIVFEDHRCCACHSSPKSLGMITGMDSIGSEAGVLSAIIATHYPYCSDKPKCEYITNHICFGSLPVHGFVSCTFCGKMEEELLQYKQCPRCKSVNYCSEECQKKHWKVHRKECQDIPFCSRCKKVETKPNTFLKCGGCKALYCSKKCQEKHLKKHAKVCKSKEASKST